MSAAETHLRRSKKVDTLEEAWAFIMAEVDKIPVPTISITPHWGADDSGYIFDVGVSGNIEEQTITVVRTAQAFYELPEGTIVRTRPGQYAMVRPWASDDNALLVIGYEVPQDFHESDLPMTIVEQA